MSAGMNECRNEWVCEWNLTLVQGIFSVHDSASWDSPKRGPCVPWWPEQESHTGVPGVWRPHASPSTLSADPAQGSRSVNRSASPVLINTGGKPSPVGVLSTNFPLASQQRFGTSLVIAVWTDEGTETQTGDVFVPVQSTRVRGRGGTASHSLCLMWIPQQDFPFPTIFTRGRGTKRNQKRKSSESHRKRL